MIYVAAGQIRATFAHRNYFYYESKEHPTTQATIIAVCSNQSSWFLDMTSNLKPMHFFQHQAEGTRTTLDQCCSCGVASSNH